MFGCSNVKLEAACTSGSQADMMQKRVTSTEAVVSALRGEFDGFRSDMSREAIQGMISTKFDGLAAMILKFY